jgi:hypothetical protein
MAKKQSVTSRSNQKKRSTKTWREKVDEYCLKYLDVHREARNLMSKVKVPSDLASFVSSPNPATDTFRKHPELGETKSITLSPEFILALQDAPNLQAIAQPGENAYPKRIADAFEIMDILVSLNNLPPSVKLNGYFFLSLWIGIGKDFVGTLRRMQYGAETLDAEKTAKLAAQFFEILAQFCRGQVPEHKGRHNLELEFLVKLILEHQTEEMSAQDLREAALAAGVMVPNGEPWRIWVWRARKNGLLPAKASKNVKGRSQ